MFLSKNHNSRSRFTNLARTRTEPKWSASKRGGVQNRKNRPMHSIDKARIHRQLATRLSRVGFICLFQCSCSASYCALSLSLSRFIERKQRLRISC